MNLRAPSQTRRLTRPVPGGRLGVWARAIAATMLAALVAGLLGACAAVSPWERGDHARRCMTSDLGAAGLEGAYWRKVRETRTAGTAITAAAGGGCGCSQ
jgi:hypothetical protein